MIKCLENVHSANVVEKYLRITAFKLHQLQAAVPDTFPALEHDDCVSSEEMNGGHRAISPLQHAQCSVLMRMTRGLSNTEKVSRL